MPLMDRYSKDAETTAEEKSRLDPIGTAEKVKQFHTDSKKHLDVYHERWASNTRLMKGIWDQNEKSKSTVRNRSKLFFRKIWSTVWRLTASLYNAYLRDPDQVKITGRMGNDDDVHKAGVLQVMVEYYRDRMFRVYDLFIQFIWAFQNILTYGWCVGLFSWEYNKAKKIDCPRFTIFAPERVFPDMTATLEHEMKFIIFESYHSKDELKAMNCKNVDEIVPSQPENSPLRSARFSNTSDPLQNPGDKEYPRPGRYNEGGTEKQEDKGLCKVWQCFYKEGGKIKYCITDGGDIELKAPEDSKYGEQYPIVMGLCLTEAHKLIGEGWPEPLEGPQVSLNDDINRRKDNVALSMNKHTIVSRFGNVDLSSLINSRPGGVTLADDVNAVKEREMSDVTQSAYVEASADEGMMQEMSGVTPSKQGMESAAKATVAQINLQESNAKIDLFVALVGETFIKRFYLKLIYLIQRFSTDEDLMRVANKTYRLKNQMNYIRMPYDVDSVDEFDADVIVDVGIGTVNRDNAIKEILLAMDKAVMANQSLIALVSTGAVPMQQIRLFDTTKFMEQLLPKIGVKNYQDYFFDVQAPPPDAENGGDGSGPMASLSGALQNPGGGPMALNALQQFMSGGGGR